MKITIDYKLNLKIKEVNDKVKEASRLGLRDTVVKIHNSTIHNSPYKTGNNRRSITSEVSGMGLVGGTNSEGIIEQDKIEGAVYSTSGYGGFLEVGTSRMSAKPYFRPALDLHKDELIPNIKKYLEK